MGTGHRDVECLSATHKFSHSLSLHTNVSPFFSGPQALNHLDVLKTVAFINAVMRQSGRMPGRSQTDAR